MLRRVVLRVLAASAVMVVLLVPISALVGDSATKARPPLGEVRIEKILDFQLPEV